MLSLLRKYVPLRIKHIFNSIYINSLSGYVLSKLYGNRIVVDDISIEINKKIINNLYYARIFFKKYERIEIAQIKKYLNPEIDTIELGSGIGITSANIIKILNYKSRLFCFEANPVLCKILKTHLRLNSKFNNYYIENKLINYNKEKIFFKQERDYLLSKVDGNYNKAEAIKIDSIELSQITNKYKIHEYNLVCDIEGSEIFILMNDRDILKNCKTLIIELHPI